MFGVWSGWGKEISDSSVSEQEMVSFWFGGP